MAKNDQKDQNDQKNGQNDQFGKTMGKNPIFRARDDARAKNPNIFSH